MFVRRMAAGVLVCALAAAEVPALPAKPATLGTVMAASDALVGTVPVSMGTTLFDGDLLKTGDKGYVSVGVAGSRLLLAPESGATLYSGVPEACVRLDHGTLMFSVSRASIMEVVALNAQIQAVANVPTAAQVSIVGPNRLFIVTKDGSVRVSYFGKVHIVRQHSEETVVLDPGEGPHALAGDGAHQPPKPPGKPPKIRYFVWIPIPFAIWEALESPDRP